MYRPSGVALLLPKTNGHVRNNSTHWKRLATTVRTKPSEPAKSISLSSFVTVVRILERGFNTDTFITCMILSKNSELRNECRKGQFRQS